MHGAAWGSDPPLNPRNPLWSLRTSTLVPMYILLLYIYIRCIYKYYIYNIIYTVYVYIYSVRQSQNKCIYIYRDIHVSTCRHITKKYETQISTPGRMAFSNTQPKSGGEKNKKKKNVWKHLWGRATWGAWHWKILTSLSGRWAWRWLWVKIVIIEASNVGGRLSYWIYRMCSVSCWCVLV